MTYAEIYDLDGNLLKDDFRWGVTPDEVLAEARTLARGSKSVVVENWLTGEVYRVTPAGHVWRAPSKWTPTWEMLEERRAEALQVKLNWLVRRRQSVQDNPRLTPVGRRRMLEKITEEQRRIADELATHKGSQQ
jgi:hypothetical protein